MSAIFILTLKKLIAVGGFEPRYLAICANPPERTLDFTHTALPKFNFVEVVKRGFEIREKDQVKSDDSYMICFYLDSNKWKIRLHSRRFNQSDHTVKVVKKKTLHVNDAEASFATNRAESVPKSQG